MCYNKHFLKTKMLHPPPQKCKYHITPLPPQNGQLSTKAAFLCSQGGHCGEVQLYYEK